MNATNRTEAKAQTKAILEGKFLKLISDQEWNQMLHSQTLWEPLNNNSLAYSKSWDDKARRDSIPRQPLNQPNKMTTKPKKKLGNHAVAHRSALEKLETAIRTAQREIEEAGYSVSTKELGKLFVTITDEGKGLYISSLGADVELEDGWRIDFPALAVELVESIGCSEDGPLLVAGLRGLADSVARLIEESK